MKLSYIDLSPVPASGNREQAILNTICTAQKLDEWGYHRIWLAEHHGLVCFAGRAPEVLIPLVAARTNRIRVGSGGVLLNHYSPYKVAINFASLEEMFPGRIDMGIGRANTGPGTDLALRKDRSSLENKENSLDQLQELTKWSQNSFPPDHVFANTTVCNNGVTPDLYVLGSSRWSASAAASLGLRYAFSGFINPLDAYSITQQYRSQFKPSSQQCGVLSPYLILALTVFCAETTEKALNMAAPLEVLRRKVVAGEPVEVLKTEEEAVSIVGNMPNLIMRENSNILPNYLAGTPEQVGKELEDIAQHFGVDEIMIHCVTGDHSSLLKSLSLISAYFKLHT